MLPSARWILILARTIAAHRWSEQPIRSRASARSPALLPRVLDFLHSQLQTTSALAGCEGPLSCACSRVSLASATDSTFGPTASRSQGESRNGRGEETQAGGEQHQTCVRPRRRPARRRRRGEVIRAAAISSPVAGRRDRASTHGATSHSENVARPVRPGNQAGCTRPLASIVDLLARPRRSGNGPAAGHPIGNVGCTQREPRKGPTSAVCLCKHLGSLLGAYPD